MSKEREIEVVERQLAYLEGAEAHYGPLGRDEKAKTIVSALDCVRGAPSDEVIEVTRYRTIVADPPWHYPHGHPARQQYKRPYDTMTIGELCELPVTDWADQSAHLFLWTTNEHLRYAFSVLGAWGFSFKNVIVWCKPGLGMGGTFRNSTELVLLGERGKCELKRRDVGTWHVWPNPKQNSAKPDGFLDLVESVSHGPYLEMFARRARFGWDYWGNESLETAEMPAA